MLCLCLTYRMARAQTILLTGTIQKDQTLVMFFYEDCTVIYGNPKRGIAYTESSIRLMDQRPIAIDENGSFYPQNEVLSLQSWGITQNISNLLPRDYDMDAPIP